MRLLSSRFSPRLVEPEILEQLTVGREALIERLVGNIAAAMVSGQGRFDLIVGPRGVGKSHTLGLVEARLRAHPQLRERVVIVSLPEEFHPSSLLHLLARVLDGLPVDPAMPPVDVQLRALRGQDASEAISMAVAMIRGRLRGRALLLMLENLDELFRDLGRKAQAQLRKIVQTEAAWSMFATACSSIALTKQSEPFHGTFVVEQLDTLSPIDCRDMMLRLAHVHEQQILDDWLTTGDALVHVRAAHHLVGGSPRVVAMLFHHLDPEHLDDFEGNFFRLAEELTPYFQEQMSRLSAGQRPVMEFLAERWAPASVSEIAEATFVPATTVSTHLRALKNNRLVRAMAVGKERYYEIADPLHRVARAMKQDRKLGAAISRMARVWALLSGGDGGAGQAESPLTLLADYCEAESNYVRQLIQQLVIHKADHIEVARTIEALMPHVQGHPSQLLAVYGLMQLGRDVDALANIKVMAAANLHRELGVLSIAQLSIGQYLAKCPMSEAALLHAYRRVRDTGELARILRRIPAWLAGGTCIRLQVRLGTSEIVEPLRLLWPSVSDLDILIIATVAWLRNEFNVLLGAQDVAARIEAILTATHSQLAPPVAHLRSCIALDDAVRTGRKLEDEWTMMGIPLWIASGRDVGKLRSVLPEAAFLPFEHALAADVGRRAFSLLGAELRTLVRELLADLELHDLLAALPPEPSV